MLISTSAIILRTVRHSDKSTIVTVYTREAGRMSCVVYGMGNRKSAFRSALFQSLTLVEIQAEVKTGNDLARIREIRLGEPLSYLTTHPVKNAISLFLAELLHKSLRQSESDPNLYSFLEHAIQLLDHLDQGMSNFHLVFMLRLAKYLGFAPNEEHIDGTYFDLLNGVFDSSQPLHPHVVPRELMPDFRRLLHTGFDGLEQLSLSRARRNALLELLIEYFRLHVSEFHHLQSKDVLTELFN